MAATFVSHMPSEERDFDLVHMINISLVKDSDGRVLLSVADSPAYLKDLGNKRQEDLVRHQNEQLSHSRLFDSEDESDNNDQVSIVAIFKSSLTAYLKVRCHNEQLGHSQLFDSEDESDNNDQVSIIATFKSSLTFSDQDQCAPQLAEGH